MPSGTSASCTCPTTASCTPLAATATGSSNSTGTPFSPMTSAPTRGKALVSVRAQGIVFFNWVNAAYSFWNGLSICETLTYYGYYDDDWKQEIRKKKYFSFNHIVNRKKPSIQQGIEPMTSGSWGMRSTAVLPPLPCNHCPWDHLSSPDICGLRIKMIELRPHNLSEADNALNYNWPIIADDYHL